MRRPLYFSISYLFLLSCSLDTKTQNSLKKALKTKLGRDVELSLKIDPDVIGGIKVSVGERTFDSLLSSKFSEIQTVLEGR